MKFSLFSILKAGIAFGVTLWLLSTLSFFYCLYNLANMGSQRASSQPVAVVKDFGKFLNEKKGSELVKLAAQPARSPAQAVSPEVAAPLAQAPLAQELPAMDHAALIESYLQSRNLDREVEFARRAVGGDAPSPILALAVANRVPPNVSEADLAASQAAMMDLRKNPDASREHIRRALHRLEGYADADAIRHTFLEIEASL